MVKNILRGERRTLSTGLGMRIAFESLMAVDPLIFRLVGKDYYIENRYTHSALHQELPYEEYLRERRHGEV